MLYAHIQNFQYDKCVQHFNIVLVWKRKFVFFCFWNPAINFDRRISAVPHHIIHVPMPKNPPQEKKSRSDLSRISRSAPVNADQNDPKWHDRCMTAERHLQDEGGMVMVVSTYLQET